MQLTEHNEEELYKHSINHGREFWRETCDALKVVYKDGFKLTNENIVDATDPKRPKWFVGAKMNIADSLMHGAIINPNKTAFIFRDDKGRNANFSYREFNEFSNQFANGLVEKGLKKGDSVGICTAAMNPETMQAYIGIMKAGGETISLLPSLQPEELRIRIKQLEQEARFTVTQDYANKNTLHPLYSNVANVNEAGELIVINDPRLPNIKLRDGDIDFSSLIKNQSQKFDSVMMNPEEAIAILFSSGTTGIPKIIPWRADCYIKSASDGMYHHKMDSNQVLCWPSNLGWMMGSYDTASAFMNNATLAVFEGNPVSREFGQFIIDAGVTRLGIVPDFAKAWRETKCMEGLDFSKVEIVMNTSAPSNSEDMEYVMNLFKNARASEYLGGTDYAGGIVTNRTSGKKIISLFDRPTNGTKIHFEPDIDDRKIVKLYTVISNIDGYVPPMGVVNEGRNFDLDEKYYPENKKNSKGEFLMGNGDGFIVTGEKKITGTITSTDGLEFKSAGRLDDIINIKGNKMPADELEYWVKNGIRKKKSAELVKDMAIFQTSPAHGNSVVYYIQLNENSDITNAKNFIYKEFRDAIKEHNPLFAVIDEIIFVDKIARNGSKIQRKAMKKEYEDILDKDKSVANIGS